MFFNYFNFIYIYFNIYQNKYKFNKYKFNKYKYKNILFIHNNSFFNLIYKYKFNNIKFNNNFFKKKNYLYYNNKYNFKNIKNIKNLDFNYTSYYKSKIVLSKIRRNLSIMNSYFYKKFDRDFNYNYSYNKNLILFNNDFINYNFYNFKNKFKLNQKFKNNIDVFSEYYDQKWDGLEKFFFKHNLKKILKKSRKTTSLFFGFLFFHEKRITKFILNYKNKSLKTYIEMIFLRISNVIYLSKIFYNIADLKIFLIKKYIYINGFTLKNLDYIVSKYDLINLNVSWYTYRYIIFNNFKFLIFGSSALLNNKVFNQNMDIFFFKRYKYFKFIDIFKYYELDFKTLSLFILYDYYFIFNTKINLFSEVAPLSSISSLNWKYLN